MTRTLIKQNLGKEINRLFGRSAGTLGQWFRSVRVGPWQPASKVRPACTVVDNGAKKGGQDDSGTTKGRVLAVHLVLDIESEGDKEKTVADWSDRVALIDQSLQNFKPAGGLRRFDYISDDPYEVILTSGSSQQIWMMEFEAEYWIEVPGLDS